jgi:hypothetical protein
VTTQPDPRAIAYKAAMEGRQIAAVDAAKKAASATTLAALLAEPGKDWALGCIYEVMIRFAMWDEILKKKEPNPGLPGVIVARFQARALALASTRRIDEAKEALAALEQAIAQTPADARQGANAARPLYEIAALKAKAWIAWGEGVGAEKERKRAEGVALLQEAVAKEDALVAADPPDSFIPVRHFLDSLLAGEGGDNAEAERVYLEDIRRNGPNGWSLAGLNPVYDWLGRPQNQVQTQQQFYQAWKHGEMPLLGSVLW